jgi:hypothetical protein
MADDGSADEIWANTKPEGGAAPPEPGATDPMPPPDPDATTVQPTAGAVDPTMVQPATAAAAAGAAGTPPGAPPPGSTEPEPSGWRPPWLIPALIALLVALCIGLFAVLASRGDDGSDTDASTTTSSSDVSTTTDPLFVPIDSDRSPGTTPPGSDTTIAVETTVPESTDAPTTDPPASDPPASDPPATDPPATDPPATDPPSSDPPAGLPDPGFARVDDETLEIRTACRIRPDDGDLEIVSYLVENSSGRIVIERWFDTGTDGVDVDIVQTRDHADSGPTNGDAVTDAFAATVTGDVTLDVAVNPPADGLDECLDFVETSVDEGSVTHGYVVLDICADGADVAGIASEGVQFSAIDQGDETAFVTFSDRTSGDLTDPEAIVITDETIVTYIGTVTNGGDARGIFIDLDLAAPRACADNEQP